MAESGTRVHYTIVPSQGASGIAHDTASLALVRKLDLCTAKPSPKCFKVTNAAPTTGIRPRDGNVVAEPV